MTESVLTARDASLLPGGITSKVSRRRVSAVLRNRCRAYWDYQMRKATIVVLQKLDDRTLADLGIDRHEIESVVYDKTRNGTRRYEWL